MDNRQFDEYTFLASDVFKKNMNFYQNFLDILNETEKNNYIRDLNNKFADKVCELANYFKNRINGKSPTPVADKRDNRFRNIEWQKNPLLDLIKQFYFLVSDWTDGVTKINSDNKNIEFLSKQILNVFSPSNLPLLNPDVVSEFIKTNGASIITGYQNFLRDLGENGELALPTADMTYFKLGENIATTPGKVVYQNDMMQLIQYAATTEKVFETPVLIISPWINKFYIMDLSPENSFVKWLVDNGHTVFIISWVNPDERHANKSFENYLGEGLLSALDEIHRLTGVKETNVVGYCLGGTLLASGMAFMKNPVCSYKSLNKIKSATLVATLTDFSDVGDFSVFTNEEGIEKIEAIMNKNGFLPGKVMFKTFNLLKSNDMIWNTIKRNYLMGQDPIKMDILFWNADCTNMALASHSFILRNMYNKNLLREHDKINLLGVGIDLRRVDTPIFMMSTEKDHIAPWKSTYTGTKLFQGPVRFVLGGSGHVAGVVNHINSGKYGYWTNETLEDSPDKWLEGAKKHPGSWWQEWHNWIQDFTGKKVKARVIKTWIEDAPGSYARKICF